MMRAHRPARFAWRKRVFKFGKAVNKTRWTSALLNDHAGISRVIARTLVIWCPSMKPSLPSSLERSFTKSRSFPRPLPPSRPLVGALCSTDAISPSELSVIDWYMPRPRSLRIRSHFACSFASGWVIWFLFGEQVHVLVGLGEVLLQIHLILQHKGAEVRVAAAVVRVANAKLVRVLLRLPRIRDFNNLFLRKQSRIVC